MIRLFRLDGGVRRDPEVQAWLERQVPELGGIAQWWFSAMRRCGRDVRELMHDGCAVACVGDVAFGYVGVFTAHVSVGFYLGAELPDPEGLLVGNGKFMRHVKLRPGDPGDPDALGDLVRAAYRDVRRRVAATAGGA